MIDRKRWEQLSALLDEVLALPAGERGAWLAALRVRDREVAEQLEPMLDAAGDDLETTLHQPHISAFEQHLMPALAGPRSGTAEHAPKAGQRMGPWALMYQIGAGGMGEVWLASRADGLFEAQAAIKLLRSDLPAASLAARFARERAVLARLNHPSVARLLDAGIAEDGQAYLVLEYVAGRTLTAHARTDCATVIERVRLLIEVAEGVDHAHAQLIVHRDLKPSNVMVTAGGEPKLLDFGIAGLLDDDGPVDTDLTKQTGRGLTLGYAAPEQILGQPIGTAADVFSLGVMLFELLTGELPFAPRHSTRPVIEQAVLHDEPKRMALVLGAPAAEPPDAGGPGRPTDARRALGDLEAVVAKALRKDPAQRYGSVRELVDDLQRWLTHRPVSVRRDDWRHRSGLWLRRHAVLAGATGLVLTSLSAGLVTTTWQWRRAELAARQAEQVTQYLGDMLASASPDTNGGKMPSMMDLLERSARNLQTSFPDDPAVELKLEDVLGNTYAQLNRFDLAIPILERRLAHAVQHHGEADERSVDARIDLARVFTSQPSPQRVVDLLEPWRDLERQRHASSPDGYDSLLYMLALGYLRIGRFDAAQQTLDEARGLVERLYQPGDFERVYFANYVSLLRSAQGHLGEAEALLRQTQPHWASAPARHARHVLSLRRGLFRLQGQLGRFDGLNDRGRALLADMDALMGPGNDMSLGMCAELSRVAVDQGLLEQAADWDQHAVQRLDAAGITHPAARLPPLAGRLLTQVLSNRVARADALAQAWQLRKALEAEPTVSGLRRAETWIALARIGLLQGDAGLVSQVLQRLRADGGLMLADTTALGRRLKQLEAELQRLQGDLPTSARLLAEVASPLAQLPDRRIVSTWAAHLDWAATLVAAGDPAAADVLARAAELRPPGLAAGHPFDVIHAQLLGRLAGPADGAVLHRAAAAAVAQAYRRPAGGMPPALTGLLF